MFIRFFMSIKWLTEKRSVNAGGYDELDTVARMVLLLSEKCCWYSIS